MVKDGSHVRHQVGPKWDQITNKLCFCLFFLLIFMGYGVDSGSSNIKPSFHSPTDNTKTDRVYRMTRKCTYVQ